MTCDPFAELVRVATIPRTPDTPADAPSRTAALFACLRQGNYSTPELGAACGLTSRQVWGLLHVHLSTGRVIRIGDAWAINPEWRSPRLDEAAALLRSHGWEVIEP